MRSAELLVTWLIGEAVGTGTARPKTAPAEDPKRGLKTRLKTYIAVVYGQGLPEEGYYAVSRSWNEVIQQMREGFKMPNTIHEIDLFNRLIALNYSTVCRVADGRITFFGKQPIKLDTWVQNMFGITGLTTIDFYRQAGTTPTRLYAGDDFGVPLTDEELDKENATKAADKEWQKQDKLRQRHAARNAAAAGSAP